MSANEASWDRIVRVVLGAVLLFLGFGSTISGAAGIIVGIVGGVLVVTGAIGYCPLYSLLKIRTNREAA
jgi:uncharacterized membrane protein